MDRREFATRPTGSYSGDLTRATRLPHGEMANAGRDRQRRQQRRVRCAEGRTRRDVREKRKAERCTSCRCGRGIMGTRGVKACARSLEAVGGRVAACIDDSDKGKPPSAANRMRADEKRTCVRVRVERSIASVFLFLVFFSALSFHLSWSHFEIFNRSEQRSLIYLESRNCSTWRE